jgi:hypothetical protein
MHKWRTLGHVGLLAHAGLLDDLIHKAPALVCVFLHTMSRCNAHDIPSDMRRYVGALEDVPVNVHWSMTGK